MTTPSDLLDRAVAAHGGLERWQSTPALHARLCATGALFALKGWPDGIGEVTVTVARDTPRTTFERFAGEDVRVVVDRGSVTVSTPDGEVIEQRADGRGAFAGLSREAPWDRLHLAYFTGYAIWNYLWAPFFLTLPGFEVHEIDPWRDQDETWRRLQVRFPPDVPTHSRDQVFHFGSDGLLRRLDYAADVLGGVPAAHLVFDHQRFDGFSVPTRRSAHARQADGHAHPEPVFVDLRVLDVERA